MLIRPIALLASVFSSFAMSSAADFHVRDFGSIESTVAINTATIQRAIDACAEAGGGRTVIPAGKPITIGTLVLKSHVELHLERGAVLLGSPRHADFTRFSSWPIGFPPEPLQKSGVIVYAEDVSDIAITGAGTIDGNSPAYVIERGTDIHQCPNERPFSVVFIRCQRLTLRDIVLKDAAYWTLRLLACDDALIDGIRIDADLLMPNNDGIDLDWSSNIRIQGCHISTGDDCITLKTTPSYTGPAHLCENIVVTNCTLVSRSSGIVVGCDAQGLIRDAIFSDCVIKDSHRGIAVRLSCNGSIEHIQFNNITVETRLFDDRWWGRAEAIQILALPWNKDYRNGVIRDIRFTNIVARGENGAVIVSNEPGHIEEIFFDRVSLRIDKTSKWDGRRQDFRPNDLAPMPEIPVSGFLLRYAADVTWRDCQVAWGRHRPEYYHHALDAEHSTGLHAEGLRGDAAQPGLPAQVVH